MTWRDRAFGHLCKDRPDVRRLLLWAEKQEAEVDREALERAAVDCGLVEGAGKIEHVSFVLLRV